jgi:5-methylcytosine-specific restriction endonuclease McrA
MERTLLLSQAYEPLNTISWQDAITKLFMGKVEVVEEYDKEIRSTSLVIKMPAVVRLINAFRRHRKRVRYSKTNVFARDRWRCQYCGTKGNMNTLTIDHVVPRSQGGRTLWENVVTACEDCNAKKANRTPEKAGMQLRTTPFRPEWVPVFSINLSSDTAPEVWKTYCPE